MLYTLNLPSVICQLHLIKLENKIFLIFNKEKLPWWSSGYESVCLPLQGDTG